MDYFAALRTFTHVVEAGSFSKTAERDGMKVSTVSRQIVALENDLGAALFNRSTRALHLTEAGRNFYQQATHILDDLEQARLCAASFALRPKGLLRLSIPVGFGHRHVVPQLADFMAEYPDIELDITMVDETTDLIGGGYDLSIRIGSLADSGLLARKLAPHRRYLMASPAYLQNSPPIDSPLDLGAHNCLLFALHPRATWYLSRRDKSKAAPLAISVKGSFRANHIETMLAACQDGLGLALLPAWMIDQATADGRLVSVLQDWQIDPHPDGRDGAIWAVYPPKKVVPPKVRAFLDFLEQRFGAPPYWERSLPVQAS